MEILIEFILLYISKSEVNIQEEALLRSSSSHNGTHVTRMMYLNFGSIRCRNRCILLSIYRAFELINPHENHKFRGVVSLIAQLCIIFLVFGGSLRWSSKRSMVFFIVYGKNSEFINAAVDRSNLCLK